jgi:hypothetical protein
VSDPPLTKRGSLLMGRIRELEAENEWLRGALMPFVRATDFYTADTDNTYRLTVRGADIRRARAVVGESDDEPREGAAKEGK